MRSALAASRTVRASAPDPSCVSPSSVNSSSRSTTATPPPRSASADSTMSPMPWATGDPSRRVRWRAASVSARLARRASATSANSARASSRLCDGDGAASPGLPGVEERLQHLMDERALRPRPERLFVLRFLRQAEHPRREVHERAGQVLVDRADAVLVRTARRHPVRGTANRSRACATGAARATPSGRLFQGVGLAGDRGGWRPPRRRGPAAACAARSTGEAAAGEIVQEGRRLDQRVVLERDRRHADLPRRRVKKVLEPRALGRPHVGVLGPVQVLEHRRRDRRCCARRSPAIPAGSAPTRCIVSNSPKRAESASSSWTPPSPSRGANVCCSIHR